MQPTFRHPADRGHRRARWLSLEHTTGAPQPGRALFTSNFIDRVIGWAKPQEAVYKGRVPGTGPLFKRPGKDGDQGREPKFVITDSIFRVDTRPNHGDLSIPPGRHSGNVIVWTGKGKYPGEVPAGFRVTKDLSVWSDARAAWMASH